MATTLVVVVVVMAAFARALSFQQRGHARPLASARGAGSTPTATATTAIYYGTPPTGACGFAGQPTCPLGPHWIDLPSASPAAVAQVISTSADYVMMTGTFGASELDVPVLVHAYPLHTGIDSYDNDHWVVTQHDATGLVTGIYDWVYDRAHHRIRMAGFAVISPQDYRAHQQFPSMSAATAISLLQSKRGVGLPPGRNPEPMFFPIDPRWRSPVSPIHWSGGGDSALDPMWHLVGMDGRDYYVGVDSRVYVQSDLPLAPGGRP